MHQRMLTEADFGLRRMDVGVDLGVWKLDKKKHDRKDSRWQDVAIACGERVLHQPVTDQTPVDEDEDGVAVELLHLGLRDKAVQADVTGDGRLIVLIAA